MFDLSPAEEKKYINFTLFTPKLLPLAKGGGVKKFKILFFIPPRYYISNLVKIGQEVLERSRRTDTNQLVVKGHSSDSGDTKTNIIMIFQYIGILLHS